MTQDDNFIATHERHAAILGEAADANKATVFDVLAAAGITSVMADFDGEGDSGGITNISTFNGDAAVPLPDSKMSVLRAMFGTDAAVATEETLYEAVESLCYDYLTQEHAGWENNDGAFGVFAFNVAARTVELEFNGRYVEIDTTTHEF